MLDDDAAFCARTLRHGAIGAILGGPIAAAVAWKVYETRIAPEGPPVGGEGSAGVMALLVTALLLGVWIGATVGCGLGRHHGTAEETCYGGAVGCLVYIVGGVLGGLVKQLRTHDTLHPVVWYLGGGTVAALIVLLIAVFSPYCRGRNSEQ